MNYANTATSRYPAHIIYVIDASSSMEEVLHNTSKRKIDTVSDILEEVAYQIYLRSRRGSVISERYRVAVFAYSNKIVEITNGDYVSVKEFIENIPEFGDLGNTSSNKYDVMIRVKELVKKTISKTGDYSPPPLICHLTDSGYSEKFDNPSIVMKEIMNLGTPDGKVLLENIYLSEEVLNGTPKDMTSWAGIANINALKETDAKFLFNHSSAFPKPYVGYINQAYGYNIKLGSRMFFPANTVDVIKIAFTATTATPVGTNIKDDMARSERESRASRSSSPKNINDSQTFDIRKLYFGSDDAESEENNGFLTRVFLETSIYSRVLNSQRELVIGRKGTGKSATRIMLKKSLSKDGIETLLITPNLLTPLNIEQSKSSSVNQDELSVLLWKYTLLIYVTKKIYDDIKRTKTKLPSKMLKLIKSFLAENGEIEKNFAEKLFSKLGFISKFSIKIFNIEGTAETRQLQAKKDFATELDKFQSDLKTIIEKLKFVNYVVMIDKVDDVWTQTKESEMMVVGLIKAVHELNIVFERVHFILFLRSDIYDNVFKFNDADKLHSVEEPILWNADELKNLIANRAQISLDLPVNLSTDDIWELIFEEKINGTPVSEYMINRTLYRPRDIIQFCNASVSCAQNNNHSIIEANDILTAEKQYSFWKLKDALSEFAVQYPFLESAFILFRGFKNQFTYKELENHFNSAGMGKASFSKLNDIGMNTLIQILFETGFLGVEVDNKVKYCYNNPFWVLSEKDIFLIHPSYHSALGLQERQ